MALVTFTDSGGRAWRVWNVERARLESVEKDYLEARFRAGWLVFESADGGERRRLTGYPTHWASLPTRDLERLCAAATPSSRPGGGLGRDADDRPRP